MKYFKIIAAFFLLMVVSLVVYSGIFPTTSAFENASSIAELKEIELGGMKQWISIRGEDVNNPVLLWLHGGPGLAQMPLSHYLDSELEKEYVVVHWDQRGAGKSNPIGFDETTMTLEQYLEDAHELTKYLQRIFDQDKIYILGHSWGSVLGLELANRYPDNYHAYISVTQIVDINEGLQMSYDWLREEILKKNDWGNFAKLSVIGKPPYNHDQYQIFALLLIEYEANVDLPREELIAIAMQAPEYSFFDYLQWVDGALRNSRPMWSNSEEFSVSYREKIPSLEIPVYFLAGRKDFTTPTDLIQDYFEKIQAPRKEMIVFENSAHTPFLKEKDKFFKEVIRIKGE